MTSPHPLRVLIGAPGAGKTTLCRQLDAEGVTVLSLDSARAQFGAGEGDQSATPAALAHTVHRLIVALREGREVAIDATSATAANRATWLGVARAFDVPVVALVLDTSLMVCLSRNGVRPADRRVPVHVVVGMWDAIADTTDGDLLGEGFVLVERVPG